MSSARKFALNPRLEPRSVAREFADRRRIHIPDFLAGDDAGRLAQHLLAREDWKLAINQGEKLFELDRHAQAALSNERLEQLELAVNAAARRGFQFRFETIRVPDALEERRDRPDPLHDFARFLCSDAVLNFFREVTGVPEISFVDAQATAYGPRHFLTSHDDEVEGKNRLAAYVLNLTPDWRTDWGGLLMFHDRDGHVEQAYTPRFNALNVFAVPQPHSVSYVTPFVPNRRYSVTGWLRTCGGR